MKTIKHIYNTDLDYIKNIIMLSAKNKKGRKDVYKVVMNIDKYAKEIQEMLITKQFKLKPTWHKTIYERGKYRQLTISPFYPNQILDYIMVETIKPYIRKGMYYYCIGNVDKKGMMFGKDAILKNYKKYKYYIKLDISKFYPSVKSTILMDYIRTKVKDKDFLQLCEVLVLDNPDLPIGCYYSQWFSNWLLQDLDHLIKEKLGVSFYVRYVDDMLLMGNNKRKLLNAMYNINNYLQTLGLHLKRFEQVYQVEQRPIDFLGFRFYDDKLLLRKCNFKSLNRKIKKCKSHICISLARSIMSYIGWLKQTRLGYLYYKNHIKSYFKLGELKRIISNWDRRKIELCQQL